MKRTTTKELKPCPFCGTKPKMGSLGGDKQNWMIGCSKCNMACSEMGINGNTKSEIIKSWNTRVGIEETT